MKKIAVVTDSVATIPDALVEELGIHVVPIVLNFSGRSYRDGVDLTPTEFYRLLATADPPPTTSTPSVGDLAAIYEAAARDAAGVVGVHVTSELSSVYETAVMAGRMLEGVPVRVIDSRSATMAQGFVALEAARVAGAGGDLDAIAARAEAVAGKARFFAFLETLEYLQRGGRIGGVAAMMGNALHVKPVLHVVSGRVEAFARPRTRRRATQTLLDTMTAQVGDRPVHAAVLHADCEEDALELRKRVADRFDCLELLVAEFTPVMGAHTGPGVLGLAFFTDEP